MYDTSLAETIRNSYPRISKDMTEFVRQYLLKHGLEIAPQLDILHLPKPSFQFFLDFIEGLVFLEEYDIFAFGLKHSPSYRARKMALGYLHAIVDNFKEGYCFGGNWEESKMMVSDEGSKFFINCEKLRLTPDLGYLDLCKYDAVVLQRFKNDKGMLPVYFKEFKDDFLLIEDSFKDSKRWETFLLLISYPFALAAPIVRSTFVLDIYRSADSESSGKDHAYSPLDTKKGIHDWKNKAVTHFLFKHVYDHKNFGNGPWTSVYTYTKWVVSHWSLLKFSRHFISHVLRYTKSTSGVQQVRDLALVDMMLGCQLGQYIAQSIQFFMFNCDLDGLFSSPWRHFVLSDCMDMPRQNNPMGTKKLENEASTSGDLVSGSTSHMKGFTHHTGWAITQVRKDLSGAPLRPDALIANADLTEFARLLREKNMKVAIALEENVTLTCGPITVYKSFREKKVGDKLVPDTASDPIITMEGPICDEFHAIFELCLWLRL